jgi:hypothetical protein
VFCDDRDSGDHLLPRRGVSFVPSAYVCGLPRPLAPRSAMNDPQLNCVMTRHSQVFLANNTRWGISFLFPFSNSQFLQSLPAGERSPEDRALIQLAKVIDNAPRLKFPLTQQQAKNWRRCPTCSVSQVPLPTRSCLLFAPRRRLSSNSSLDATI